MTPPPATRSPSISQWLQTIFSRPQKVTCPWAGKHAGPPIAAVDITRPCGHSEGTAVPTCTTHLNTLISTNGTAPQPTPCTACGALAAPRIAATHDLP